MTNYPNLTDNLATYVNGLPAFPVNRSKAVRYGYTDSQELPMVEFRDAVTTPDQWTTCGPQGFTSTFTVSCFASKQQDAYTLALAVNAAFAGQQVTAKTVLCEPLSLTVVQEGLYRFHAQLAFKLSESI